MPWQTTWVIEVQANSEITAYIRVAGGGIGAVAEGK